ncbi:DUF6082 family protein [Streptomyces zagrosensis]|uniref:Peptide transporter permease SapC n=1 Tax=Streptomyces zagrosensis TaxID=1042984 RepID=A0A7W9Q5S7_9ACTN|nr:DUF6082 family protein [Streptomyces zagrosensis]MBB5933112.1 hypothetical protein [Streptomyces zagrosensis]
MKLAHALLIVAAVGTAQLVLSGGQHRHRQKLALDAASMHAKWISDVAADTDHQAVWAIPGEATGEEYAQCNRLVAFLAVKYRVGLLDRQSLRTNVRRLMDRGIARSYWSRFGSFREEEAADRIDRAFNAVMADEFELNATDKAAA